MHHGAFLFVVGAVSVGAFAACSSDVTTDNSASTTAPSSSSGSPASSSSSSSSSGKSSSSSSSTASSMSSSSSMGGMGTGGMGGSGGMTQPPSDITGTAITSTLTPTGTQQYPDSYLMLSALTPIGKGMFSQIQGSIQQDGSFDIPNVPGGVAYLESTYGGGYYDFYVSPIRKYDLGYDMIGRTDSMYPSNTTTLELNLTDMTAWAAGDDLQIFSAGVDDQASLTQATGTSPMNGDTSVSSYDIDISTLNGGYLMEGSEGDVAIVTHLVNSTTGALTYGAVTEAATLPSFDMTDGMKSIVSGAFAPVAQTSLDFDWRRSQFEALAGDVHPNAQFSDHYLAVATDPGGAVATTGYVPTLASLFDYSTGDVKPTIAYGDPFPASWRETVTFESDFYVTYQIGNGMSAYGFVWTTVVGPASMLANAAVEPIVSPPRKLQINGMSATTTLSGVTTTPTFSWTSPSVGAPKSYVLYLISIDAMGNQSYSLFFTTDQTSITVPPGLLQKGAQYYLEVFAESDVDMSAPERVSAGVHGESGALTGLFTP